jgi:DNA-binding response OmpR family regulator
MAHILVVEDDAAVTEILVSDLKLEGYTVTTAKDGLEGLDKAKAIKPDLILLDVRMPVMDGYEVCRALRKSGSDVLIIMLTAKGQDTEKVVGLDQGADDYMTKPYSSIELIARIRALFRRQNRLQNKSERVEFDDIVVDFSRMEAAKHGKPLGLTTKEFQMLELLLRNRGRVVSRDQFLEEVWGYELKPTTRTVDSRVMRLRQKLSPDDPEKYILSIHGTGYKFVG